MVNKLLRQAYVKIVEVSKRGKNMCIRKLRINKNVKEEHKQDINKELNALF
jgi:hypothetical protein